MNNNIHSIKEKYNLSDRESEVLNQIILGKTVKEISDYLCISVATVKTHKVHIMNKMNVKKSTLLVKICMED